MQKEKMEKLRQICKNISVLYVEDEKDIAEQLEKLLKKIFVKVDVEKNGFLGLRSYKQKRHDIIISDISMPSMDGIEMSKRVRKINNDQIIIITSAHNDIEYLMELIDIGVDKFVLKPVDMNLFMTSVANAAVNIYREKKEMLLEKKIKKHQEIQLKIMNNIPVPLCLVERGVFKYVNGIFKKYFIRNNEREKIEQFKLAYIFEDKKFITMSNSEFLKYLLQNNTLHSIAETGAKIYKKYKINIVSLDEESYLLSFLNVDSLSMEFNKVKSSSEHFGTIKEYKYKIADIMNGSEQEYSLLCVSLKNRKKFIEKYGGGKMHFVYEELAKHLKNDFDKEIKLQNITIFLFERNRYVFLVEEECKKRIVQKIVNFGNNYSYSFGSTQPLYLDFVSESLDKSVSLEQIIENTESMLHLLD